MNRLAPCALLVLLATSAAQAEPCPAADAEALRKLKLETWPGLYQSRDVAGLGQLLHADFRVVDAEGGSSTRAEEIDWLRQNAWTERDFRYRIDALYCVGDTAVIIGQGSTGNAQTGGRDTYVSSNVLKKVDGRWQALVSHLSGIKEDAPKR